MNYENLQGLLRDLTAESDIAEAHGMLCGLLCADEAFQMQDWLKYTLGESQSAQNVPNSALIILQQVYDQAVEQLNDLELGFNPILPDDTEALSERVSALGEWCGGFLQGLAVANPASIQQLSEDAAEIVKDFSEITKAEFGSNEESDEDEQDYMELIEYIRMSALLINEELRADKSSPVTLH